MDVAQGQKTNATYSLSYVDTSSEPLALCILLGVPVEANELGKVWEG